MNSKFSKCAEDIEMKKGLKEGTKIDDSFDEEFFQPIVDVIANRQGDAVADQLHSIAVKGANLEEQNSNALQIIYDDLQYLHRIKIFSDEMQDIFEMICETIQEYLMSEDTIESKKSNRQRKIKEEKEMPQTTLGNTNAVLDFVNDHWKVITKEAEKKMIPPEKYWPFLTANIAKDLGVASEDLIKADVHPKLVIDSFEEFDYDLKEQVSSYSTLMLKKKDGSIVNVDLEEVLPKIEAHTEQFNTPMDALKSGRNADILQLFQSIYGDDVVAWTVPAGQSNENVKNRISKFVSLIVSKLIKERNKKDLKEWFSKFIEAFDKNYLPELVKLFPNVDSEYLKCMVSETKTVFDELGSAVCKQIFINMPEEFFVKESKLVKEKKIKATKSNKRKKSIKERNMSYVAFENTYPDLKDCYEIMLETSPEEAAEKNVSERQYHDMLLELCQTIVDEYGDEHWVD